LDNITSQLISFSVHGENEPELVEVKTHTRLSPPILAWGYNIEATYTICSRSILRIKVHIQPSGSHPDTVPRVGLDIRLPRTIDKATWYGTGPGKSYPDKRSSKKVGIWSRNVEELQTKYDHPQENGNRMETRWVKIVNLQAAGIKITREVIRNEDKPSEETFKWSAGRSTAATLEKGRHPCDLIEEDATLLKVNAEVAGLGSASCGPGMAGV
jgi:beta-galactosidase